jgi:hypothetical protein
MKNWEEIATQGSGSNCGVGVGARVSVSNVFAGTCSKQEKKQLVDCIIFTLSGMDGLYSLRCNFPVHE